MSSFFSSSFLILYFPAVYFFHPNLYTQFQPRDGNDSRHILLECFYCFIFFYFLSIQPSREYYNSRSKRFLVCTAYAVGLFLCAFYGELETFREINVSFLPAEGAPAAVHWLWPVSFPSRPTRRHPPRHSGHAESWDCIIQPNQKQQPKNMGDKSIGITTFPLIILWTAITHAALVAQCWMTAW